MPRQRISLPGKTVGSIEISVSTTVPDGYLLCDGSPISRTLYPKLFAAIGTAHGVGDGATTFNLPDYRYMVPRGKGGVADRNFLPADVNTSAGLEQITITGHDYKRTGFRVRVSSTVALPGGLAANTDYYVIIVNANTIKLATTRANALAGSAIDLTSQGTGVHTISQAEGPDYSLRSAVNGGNAGDNVGSLEEDTVQGHGHNDSSRWAFAPGGSGGNISLWPGAGFSSGTSSGFNIIDPIATGAFGSPRTSKETRPSNALCNYIIKVI